MIPSNLVLKMSLAHPTFYSRLVPFAPAEPPSWSYCPPDQISLEHVTFPSV